jgi:hypothetical protein
METITIEKMKEGRTNESMEGDNVRGTKRGNAIV